MARKSQLDPSNSWGTYKENKQVIIWLTWNALDKIVYYFEDFLFMVVYCYSLDEIQS
jgi:hypothetical protein